MARKEVQGKSEIEKYRKNLGKHEFSGRSKRNTLKSREKAQARKSSHPLQTAVLYLAFVLAVLLALYCLFFMLYDIKKTE
ncbi:triple QxxK/R motif-containing protein-like [Actinia tenebrosa]|uniref:Triple QxxK/R motif-containing protein-like n=1 Tax=Actinia tenebrosa TaxID=6105 RepID=A0A6P8HSJ7_ACTTE|nr:triple QxxK/R motif-containing protein-like [Actinia tenebrosa]